MKAELKDFGLFIAKHMFVIVIVGLLLVVGCKTFTPIWIDELPAECNMSLNQYRIYYNSEDKSGTKDLTTACLKKLQREYCKEEVFGEKKVDYNDQVLYRNFTECRKEVQ